MSAASFDVGGPYRAAGGGLGRALRATLRGMMAARAASVLHALSDAQLREIGMTRQDVPDRVRRMIDHEI